MWAVGSRVAAAESSATWSKMIDLGGSGRGGAGFVGVVPGSDWAGRVAVVVIVIVIVTARKRAGVGRVEVAGRSYAGGRKGVGGQRNHVALVMGDGKNSSGRVAVPWP